MSSNRNFFALNIDHASDNFYFAQWLSQIKLSPAAKVYVARVQEVAATKPYLLVAHQYTRYLGDLFGGQMMGGMASRSLDLANGDGTAFYTSTSASGDDSIARRDGGDDGDGRLDRDAVPPPPPIAGRRGPQRLTAKHTWHDRRHRQPPANNNNLVFSVLFF